MERRDLTKEQLIDQVTSLQEKINSLENTVLAQSQTEDTLRISENNLSDILEKNADGIIIVDTDGNVLYVNPAAEKLFGRSKEDFLGYEFGFPVSADNEFDTIAIRNGSSSCEVELRIVQVYWKSQQAYQLSIRDVTKRVITEKALIESEEKSRVIFDNANDGMFLVDPETSKFLRCNVSCAQMLGYQQEEFPDLEIVDIHPKEDLLFLYKQIERFNKGFESIRTDIRFKRKNGDILFADISSTFMTIAGKKHVLMVFRDISERKLMEDKLKKSEKSFRTLAENIPASVYRLYLREKNNMKFFNNNIEKISGYNKEDLVDGEICSIDSFILSEDKPQVIEIITNAVRNKSEFTVEYRFNHKDGTVKYFKEKGRTVLGEDEKPLYIDGVIYDETERKQVEMELIKAKEKAEESDRLKSAFLTNMSHEIRTPMNGIIGFADLLKEPTLSSDELQDYIQIIQISGSRMLNTINNIVDISKIESGLVQPDINETNINEKMEFTYNFFKPEAEFKKLKLSLKRGLLSKESNIKTDNEKVYGILTNLVKNAIKFTNVGSIELGYEKKGQYLEFFVKDTGIGVPQNKKELIFERFRQGSESENRGYEGSGLGLSIAKSYVKMLGGEIWMESEEGKGSTFYFTIPYNAVSEVKKDIQNTFSEKKNEVQHKKLRILIVEDDEISHSLLSRMLQNINCEVLHAITGAGAVEACRTNTDIDLILMDIRMPNMDGNEATRQIRQFNKDVIIIAQTAYAFNGDREISIEAGCNNYVTKPINMILLAELVKSYFN